MQPLPAHISPPFSGDAFAFLNAPFRGAATFAQRALTAALNAAMAPIERIAAAADVGNVLPARKLADDQAAKTAPAPRPTAALAPQREAAPRGPFRSFISLVRALRPGSVKRLFRSLNDLT